MATVKIYLYASFHLFFFLNLSSFFNSIAVADKKRTKKDTLRTKGHIVTKKEIML